MDVSCLLSIGYKNMVSKMSQGLYPSGGKFPGCCAGCQAGSNDPHRRQCILIRTYTFAA
jgi:hypothetical protein